MNALAHAGFRADKPKPLPALRADALPPSNVELEQAVIGECILNPHLVPDVLAVLQPEHIYRERHQVWFQAIADLHAQGVGVDALTVSEHLERKGLYRDAGGDDFLGELHRAAGTPCNTLYHAQILRYTAIERNTLETLQLAAREIQSKQFRGDEARIRALSRLQDIAPPSTCGGLKPLGSLVDSVWAKYLRRLEGEITGTLTGFADFDSLTDGFQDEELIVLAARPSMGKSALAGNICENISLDLQKAPTLFVSLEMSAESLAMRSVISRARLDSQAIKTGQEIGERAEQKAREVRQKLKHSPMKVIDRISSSYLNVQQVIREAHARDGIRLACVDYLQLMTAPGSKENATEVVDKMCEAMKSIARQCRIPVLLLSQLNRACESRTDKRPMLADLRSSGAIEQHADVVLFLYREPYYDKLFHDPTAAELIIAKNRNGPTGMVPLRFDAKSIRFDNHSYRTDEDVYVANRAGGDARFGTAPYPDAAF